MGVVPARRRAGPDEQAGGHVRHSGRADRRGGPDAAWFHLLMFSSDVTMTFDIEVVKRQSLENPVYYVQYGHARIASILRKAAERGVEMRPIEEVDLERLGHEAELDLLRALADAPSQIATAASCARRTG